MMHSGTLLLLVAALAASSTTATYVLQDDYQPDNFFDGFDFHDGLDPNDGYVHYLDRSAAEKQQLASSENGSVYMGIDASSSSAAGKNKNGRGSVRIESKKTYHGGLILLDAAHMPGGVCGTWPAFWTVGPNWPTDGEVDIIEGINSQTANILAVHTMDGCTVEETKDLSADLLTPNCDINAADQDPNQGCHFKDTDPASYGAGFNKIGGGVYATEWTDDAISVWFFPRDRIPPDVSSQHPDPSSWPKPHARFAGSCNFKKHLKDQRFIINTALCGDWANSQWADDPVCSSKASTCDAFVRDNPDAFKDAYWEINYMKVFQDGGPKNSSSSSSSSTVPDSTTTTPVSKPPPTPSSSSAPTAPSNSGSEYQGGSGGDGHDNNNNNGASPSPAPAPPNSAPNDCPTPKPKPPCSTYVSFTTNTVVRSASPTPSSDSDGNDNNDKEKVNAKDDYDAIVSIPTDVRRRAALHRRWHH